MSSTAVAGRARVVSENQMLELGSGGASASERGRGLSHPHLSPLTSHLSPLAPLARQLLAGTSTLLRDGVIAGTPGALSSLPEPALAGEPHARP